ncbi:hypothetical protein E4U43_007927 [Claviceps pusilla]|uniref:C6 transcription factor n=1 Tax=Claviceps pusilla TaxID=123648 RepID=A0A9P7T047_9HYPO|nr:hypothetical protein E4U43_007927 [Claviceps pusilla]
MAGHINSHFLSPGSTSTADEYAANPRFIELQEELRCVLFAGVSSHDPNHPQASKKPVTTAVHAKIAQGHDDKSHDSHETWSLKSGLDSARVNIPKIKLVRYLQNWIVECAPYLDKFDDERHFGIHVPIMAEQSPALLYAVLAFSARQIELKALLEKCYDSLELYQQSILLLGPGLEARDPNMLVTACILAVLELMSGSSRNWRRHIEGCATLFDFFGVTGFSGGLLQAVFWCYARMELCGAIISGGAESTVLPLSSWLPPRPLPPRPPPPPPPPSGFRVDPAHGHAHDMDAFARQTFYQHGRENTCMHANWAVYLCAKVCDLIYRRTRTLELQEPDASDPRPFDEQWTSLWQDLQLWLESRPQSMLPTTCTRRAGVDVSAHASAATTPSAADQGDHGHHHDHEQDHDHDHDHGDNNSAHVFPSIFFPTLPAISSNQLYHTACILMLETRPPNAAAAAAATASSARLTSPQCSPIWHARRVCGISYTNPHKASLINAIQPLYVAGRLLTHPTEQLQVARLFAIIDGTTGWGALWRLRDLEAAWGYESGEMLRRVNR